jgi:hypothetical protein
MTVFKGWEAQPSNTILFQGSEYQYEYQFLGKPAEKAAARALCNGRDPEAIELLAHKQLPESTGGIFSNVMSGPTMVRAVHDQRKMQTSLVIYVTDLLC